MTNASAKAIKLHGGKQLPSGFSREEIEHLDISDPKWADASMSARLFAAIAQVGDDVVAVAVGKSAKQLGRYTKGDELPVSVLKAIADVTGVPSSWILTGTPVWGHPLDRSVVGSRTQSREHRDVVSIARYSVQASAGSGAVVLAQEAEDYFKVGRDWLERYVPRGAPSGIIEARGDSMEPTIRDGDILLLNFQIDRQDVANGGVFVVTIDGNLFVKRLQIMLDGAIQILSDNDRYQPEIVDREYADEKMQVHAKVVWAGGPLR